MAITYSLSSGKKFDPSHVSNHGGKEYSKGVLFGDYLDYYAGLVCVHYGRHKTDKDIPKLIKMHLDDGLESLQEVYEDNPQKNPMEFLMDLIE
jgi:DNA sulfur modification protein DndE